MSEEYIEYLQEQLAQEIGLYVQDNRIINAFQAVPRHEFIKDFFEFNKTTRKWEPIVVTSAGWLERVYTNIQLVTSLNQYNRPNCSSSKPDIMAKKLACLHLHSGKRVLEIGTGTGYNAAILSCIVGNKNVVTLDINETLLAEAQERLDRIVGPGITVLHVDGRNLPAYLGQFDAILVAASSQCIEPSWIQALNHQGRLIVNWNKSFSKVFFELEKQGEGLIGNVASFGGDFMELHDGNGIAPVQLDWDKYAPVLEEETDFRDHLPCDVDFGFFVQIHIPSLRYSRFKGNVSNQYHYAIGDAQGRLVYLSKKVRGDALLWKELKELHEKFVSLGKPRSKDLSLQIACNGDMTFFYRDNEITVIKSNS
jgi:protein-L-isoaspartate O-methyltransferase